ncbi:MAG: hypothetical protein U1E76_15950 [Planctomycetota bacterium]
MLPAMLEWRHAQLIASDQGVAQAARWHRLTGCVHEPPLVDRVEIRLAVVIGIVGTAKEELRLRGTWRDPHFLGFRLCEAHPSVPVRIELAHGLLANRIRQQLDEPHAIEGGHIARLAAGIPAGPGTAFGAGAVTGPATPGASTARGRERARHEAAAEHVGEPGILRDQVRGRPEQLAVLRVEQVHPRRQLLLAREQEGRHEAAQDGG